MCAASNAILSTRMDDDLFGKVISAEAAKHSEKAREAGATQEELENMVYSVGNAYNKGTMTWDQITDFAQGCATTDIGDAYSLCAATYIALSESLNGGPLGLAAKTEAARYTESALDSGVTRQDLAQKILDFQESYTTDELIEYSKTCDDY